jgi:hypothetical protein
MTTRRLTAILAADVVGFSTRLTAPNLLLQSITGTQIPLRRPARIAYRWEAKDHRQARQHIRRLVT